MVPANKTKERSVHELFTWAFRVNRACFPKRTPEFTKMGETHELSVLAGATPDERLGCWFTSSRSLSFLQKEACLCPYNFVTALSTALRSSPNTWAIAPCLTCECFLLYQCHKLRCSKRYRFQIQSALKTLNQKRPFVHNSVCSQFLEGLFAIVAECSQFCLRPF